MASVSMGLPVQGRDRRRAGRRVRHRYRRRLELRHRDRGAAGRPAAKLRQAPRHARKAGHACLVSDGTFIPVDRVAAGRPFYSGKHPKYGMNLHVIASPGGIVWVPGPGSARCTT
jgi:hypothetical protein